MEDVSKNRNELTAVVDDVFDALSDVIIEKTVFKFIGAFDVLRKPLNIKSLIKIITAAWIKNLWKEERHRKTHALRMDRSPIAAYDSGYVEAE